VDKPTLGLVGEGKNNEAIVPLPDGRSIPVIGNTGSSPTTNNNSFNINVNVTNSSDEESSDVGQEAGGEDSAQQLGTLITQSIQAELVAQQRPGGLLSQY